MPYPTIGMKRACRRSASSLRQSSAPGHHFFASPTIGRGIKKRLDRDPPRGVPKQGQDAVPIGRVESDHSVGAPDRALRCCTARGPSSMGLLWRIRSLGDNIRNSECIGNYRTEPIRGFVIEVIGEPKLRCGFRHVSASAKEAFGDARAERSKPSLALLVPLPVIAAKAGGYKGVYPADRKAASSSCATRRSPDGNRMVGRF